MSTFLTPSSKPIAQMSPEELHAHGIPVEVALQARLTDAEQRMAKCAHWLPRDTIEIEVRAYRDALAIVQATSSGLRSRAEEQWQLAERVGVDDSPISEYQHQLGVALGLERALAVLTAVRWPRDDG